MGRFELRVIEHRLGAGRAIPLAVMNGIIYVVEGRATIATHAGTTTVGANEAWHGAAACTLTAGDGDARVWRWELAPLDRPSAGPAPALGTLLAREIELDAGTSYLVRCDRVDFPPGGVAYTHTHRGPGIRVLLAGTLRVETGGRVLDVRPGQAWFERGPEPVYAAASEVEPTSFVRVLVLPAELAGKSSIRYVRVEDQDKPKTQRYTIFVDAPITV